MLSLAYEQFDSFRDMKRGFSDLDQLTQAAKEYSDFERLMQTAEDLRNLEQVAQAVKEFSDFDRLKQAAKELGDFDLLMRAAEEYSSALTAAFAKCEASLRHLDDQLKASRERYLQAYEAAKLHLFRTGKNGWRSKFQLLVACARVSAIQRAGSLRRILKVRISSAAACISSRVWSLIATHPSIAPPTDIEEAHDIAY